MWRKKRKSSLRNSLSLFSASLTISAPVINRRIPVKLKTEQILKSKMRHRTWPLKSPYIENVSISGRILAFGLSGYVLD